MVLLMVTLFVSGKVVLGEEVAPSSDESILALIANERQLEPIGNKSNYESLSSQKESRQPLLTTKTEKRSPKSESSKLSPLEESYHEQVREALLDEVDRAWKRPQLSKKEGVTAAYIKSDDLQLKLNQIHVPRIEFSDTPLSEVINVLSLLTEEQGDGDGLNLVLLDPSRTDPLLTLTLRNLKLNRVLDYIVETVGFTYDVRSDAIVIRPRIGPGYGLETQFFPISRATMIRLTGLPEQRREVPVIDDPFSTEEAAETQSTERQAELDLKDFLQRAGIPFAQIEGADLALADGQLIVTQTARNLEKIESLLRRYSETKQVEIEARFIEVQDRNLEELGFEWTLLSGGDRSYDSQGLPIIGKDGEQVLINRNQVSNGPTRTLGDVFASSQLNSRIIIDRPGVDLPDLFQGPPQLPSRFELSDSTHPLAAINGVVDGMDLGLIIRALERQSGNDLLSAPKVTVLSGKTAEIVVAEEFRYPMNYGDTDADVGLGDSTSGSAGVAITTGTPRDFTMRNVGVEMKVTPIVEENNSISLRLEPKVTELEGFVEYGGPSVAIASDTTVTVPSGFYQPIFSVRKVNTEVTIWDGATVVMGGLTREQAIKIADKVPLLGDLPLLGRLFRSESESTQKRNLLIFVTASLVSPGGSPAFQRIPGIPPQSIYETESILTPAGYIDREEGHQSDQ